MRPTATLLCRDAFSPQRPQGLSAPDDDEREIHQVNGQERSSRQTKRTKNLGGEGGPWMYCSFSCTIDELEPARIRKLE